MIELVLEQSAVIMARPSDKDIEGSYQVRSGIGWLVLYNPTPVRLRGHAA